MKKQNLLTFTKKAALVTGAAKRLGAYISEILASCFYDLILHYNESHTEVVSLKKSLEKRFNINVEIYKSDLIASQKPEEMISRAFCIFPHLSLLVNNASFFIGDSLETASKDIFDSYYEIHVLAPFLLAQSFISYDPLDGKVINILDSLVKKNGSKKYFSYLFSKKCLYELTLMMKNSIENKNTKFYSVNPEVVINDDGSFNRENLKKFKTDFENILRE